MTFLIKNITIFFFDPTLEVFFKLVLLLANGLIDSLIIILSVNMRETLIIIASNEYTKYDVWKTTIKNLMTIVLIIILMHNKVTNLIMYCIIRISVNASLSIRTVGLDTGFNIALSDRIKKTLTEVRITGYKATLVIALHKAIVKVFANKVITTNVDSFTMNFNFEVIECFTNNLSNRKVITLNNTFIKFDSSDMDLDPLQLL